MQSSDYVYGCGDCGNSFNSASLLLQHFVEHSNEDLLKTNTPVNKKTKTNLPALYPIKAKSRFNAEKEVKSFKCEEFGELSVLKYCEVTMEDHVVQGTPSRPDALITKHSSSQQTSTVTVPKRYKCSYCTKTFGWSTDLKRHILIHTGEKPFKCTECPLGFTRNFLLQKHLRKAHTHPVSDKKNKINIPDLKPITSIFRHKGRKQDKYKIRRQYIDRNKMVGCIV